jgi:chaperonin GroES
MVGENSPANSALNEAEAAEYALVLECVRPTTQRNSTWLAPLKSETYALIDTSLEKNTYYLKERSTMNIRPLHDRVIVKRLEEDRTSPGGIVIPDTAAEKPIHGKIVAVGKGKILENGQVRPCDVKVGDKILFGKYSGTEVKVEGEELLVMREEDIMAVIESK